jgi:hypothetical protein
MRVPVLSLTALLFACGPQTTTVNGTGGGMGGGGTGGAGGGGGSATLTRADGTLGTWDILSPLPVARANHCAVAVGEFLLVAGGNYKPIGGTDFLTLDDVRSAKVLANGQLTAWDRAGTLPSPATDCILAASGRTVVLAGALFQDNTLNSRIWTATLDDAGHLSPWQEIGVLPYMRRAISAGAWLQGDTLYVSDTLLPTEGTAEAIVASATLGNMLGPWTRTQYQTGFRGKPLGAITSSAVFIIGGYVEGNAVVTDVTAVPLSGDPPAATTPLPEGRSFGAAVAVDDFIFVTGGRAQILGVAPSKATFSAKATGASVGAWSPQAQLPDLRSNHTAIANGDWLFVIGGGNGSGGLDTVYRARVKHPVAQ